MANPTPLCQKTERIVKVLFTTSFAQYVAGDAPLFAFALAATVASSSIRACHALSQAFDIEPAQFDRIGAAPTSGIDISLTADIRRKDT